MTWQWALSIGLNAGWLSLAMLAFRAKAEAERKFQKAQQLNRDSLALNEQAASAFRAVQTINARNQLLADQMRRTWK
jgi:hypothetical protein